MAPASSDALAVSIIHAAVTPAPPPDTTHTSSEERDDIESSNSSSNRLKRYLDPSLSTDNSLGVSCSKISVSNISANVSGSDSRLGSKSIALLLKLGRSRP